MNLQIGTKLSVFGISDFMACTTHHEIAIKREVNGRYTCVQRGKRKEFYLKNYGESDLVFEGWDLPIKTDSESFSRFSGNACLNLVGDKEVIKNYVENKNLNPNFTSKGHIVLVEAGEHSNKETVLYPEIETSHAVIDRIKAQAIA